jgi:hypothetical protein
MFLMPTHNFNLTDSVEQREQEDQAKLEWLRSAAKEGFDAIGRGDFTTISSDKELDEFFDQVHKEVSSELAAEQGRG